MKKEIFGPVLHVVRYARQDLDKLIGQINAAGYGLTLGIHTRIDETIHRVTQQAHVGNMYVNRNMVGAVVGVQPFGGEGLSGTGPKAGGPLYLYRLLSSRPPFAVQQTLLRQDANCRWTRPCATRCLHRTARCSSGQPAASNRDDFIDVCTRFAESSSGRHIAHPAGTNGRTQHLRLVTPRTCSGTGR